jgi:hypothetical protein
VGGDRRQRIPEVRERIEVGAQGADGHGGHDRRAGPRSSRGRGGAWSGRARRCSWHRSLSGALQQVRRVVLVREQPRVRPPVRRVARGTDDPVGVHAVGRERRLPPRDAGRELRERRRAAATRTPGPSARPVPSSEPSMSAKSRGRRYQRR